MVLVAVVVTGVCGILSTCTTFKYQGTLWRVGCELRRSRALQRRRYSSPGPNHTWHVDGYDKLKPFGFPVHGCIDGWSRRIMCLKLTRSNKIFHNVLWYSNVVQLESMPHTPVTTTATKTTQLPQNCLAYQI